jgi:CRP-like cAMP-binding protein
LIELLPKRDQRSLLNLAERISLGSSEVLGKAGTPNRYVYFPIDSFISLVTSIENRPVLEVGMVGREGMLGAQVTLGVATQPLHALVQGAGSAWRITTPTLRQELTRNKALNLTLDRYVYVLMSQLASSAACIRFHHIKARLARWLLMMQDRAHSDSFGVTHEFLAYMLGVRREGITAAAGALKGLIDYKRGWVTVLNRRGLKAVTCTCYDADKEVYARIMH